MKFGLDIHGVINKCPKFFSKLSKSLISSGHEIHIITGSRITSEIEQDLLGYGMEWTVLFSITDYHLKKGTSVNFDEKGNPWIDEPIWNKAKGFYCLEAGIDFHIDDSSIYGQHFETPYCHFNYQRKRFEWFFKDSYSGEFLISDEEKTIQDILEITTILNKEVKNV